MGATIADIAAHTGKSRSTVSRVLRDSTKFPISERSRQQILTAARELNYVPAHSARSLATGRSYCVAVVLGQAEKDLAEPNFAPTLVEMTRVCLQQGYHLALLPTEARDEDLLRTIRGRRIDGFYVGTNMLGAEAMAELAIRRMPLVTTELSSELAESGQVSVVRRDDQPALEALARELVRRGHRRIAFLAPDYFVDHPLPIYATYLPRFRAALQAAGLEGPSGEDILYRPVVRGILASRAEARQAAEAALDRLRRHTAVVTNSDFIALGVADALRAAGIEPGRQMALVGYNNSEQSTGFEVAEPFLTTVDPHYRARGAKIAELLIERIENPAARPRVCEIPSTLVVRKSLMDAPRPQGGA